MFEVFKSETTANITREHLVNLNPEELYMSHYLGINPQYGLFCSPLRKDTNPTCSFYRDKANRLIFKDFGDNFHGDFLAVVKKIYNCSYGRAIAIVANDFGIKKNNKLPVLEPRVEYNNAKIESTSQTIIQCEIKKWSTPDLKWWRQFGITRKTLDKFRVFAVQTVFLNGEIFAISTKSCPIYGYYYGKKDGIEQWKIYFPKKVSHRFLLNTSIVQGLDRIPNDCNFIVITKSLKDVMTLYELGVPAIAPQAETVILDKKLANKLLTNNTKYLIVNGDYDRAGINFMQASRKAFPCIAMTIKDKEKNGKDISDYVEKYGIEEAKKLIIQLKKDFKAGKFDYQLKYCKQ